MELSRGLSRDEIQDILEAREAKERAVGEKGADQLAKLLTTPQSGMSRRFTVELQDAGEGEDGKQ